MSSQYASQFGIGNIPYGIASSTRRPAPQCATRIGDDVIFLAELSQDHAFQGLTGLLADIFRQPTLNQFAAQPQQIHKQVRAAIQKSYESDQFKAFSEKIGDVTLHMPVHIGDFTDFSASADHVQNAAEAILGVRSFPPAFHKYPVGYAGRCSSINVSGTPVSRPLGQYIEDHSVPQKRIIFGPCRALDYELELGAIIGRPVQPGTLLNAKDADEHIFGFVLVNDWSARDIQALEMNPLGPFNGKNFATIISPWIVTCEALEPYRAPAPTRKEKVAAFMDDPDGMNYKIELEIDLTRNGSTSKVCKVGFETMYWTFRHMLAHHTIGGCGLRTGDMIASGTVSGEGIEEHGCSLELTMNGKKPWKLVDGAELRYLEDGDVVHFRAVAGNAGDGVGFGECFGEVLAAKNFEAN